MPELTDAELKKIIARRDPRFDGRFYFGVKTTKIYCRPVCPAKPKPENILIFKSHSEAEQKGYRPCKRCKPDLFPGQRSIDSKYIQVGLALEIIDASEDFLSVSEIAQSLRITTRHLRRLFEEYLGASPIEVINSNRLHLAKKFLTETKRSVTEIAYAVGYNSLRRFNESFKELYKVTPSQLRKEYSPRESSVDSIQLEILVRKPYDWNYVIHHLDKHLIYGSEIITNGKYLRFIPSSKNQWGTILVCFDEQKSILSLECSRLSLSEIKSQLPKIKKLFDVDHNPNNIPSSRKNDKSMRVPGCYNSFEIAVSIIIGQLITTKQAKKKVEELVKKFGERSTGPTSEHDIIFFPSPAILANAELEVLGLPKVKANAIRMLSQQINQKKLELSYLKDIESTKLKLLEIKGIGPWTTELIAMRCLGDINAFPSSDLFIRRALNENMINEEKWQGLRAYLCHLVWRDLYKELLK
ncbi:MAG: hypothetical protein COW00_12610 [Bdellovibrio sp. CG12_big_fil_rev_8_21_14_0_65_39_13]|nr:MAG: hypothetical protein COW78_06900 [Bdellovibrio sp. CG22_combo_CG10-13_8_21_14_all_39_27]PIQ59026.1 MAG: hypothetical protein COW00_12610 [Bdellovibrio sp. CG12_big_fil_rev_8_21_14_0_65_39_13]PIR33002.1 MAG: hypothetical protein COV37_18070 [Bdellovibrio sp. CG11_big_fil_rev_8_21_14_0_20_39_38]PJB53328.1 MAG: hypothetical protein CO099_07735 [Bdellovibrio sp. CG_4_9_14_3_um_filter_39_7]